MNLGKLDDPAVWPSYRMWELARSYLYRESSVKRVIAE